MVYLTRKCGQSKCFANHYIMKVLLMHEKHKDVGKNETWILYLNRICIRQRFWAHIFPENLSNKFNYREWFNKCICRHIWSVQQGDFTVTSQKHIKVKPFQKRILLLERRETHQYSRPTPFVWVLYSDRSHAMSASHHQVDEVFEY